MRRFATDVLGGQRIDLEFHSSVAGEDLRIGADVRRQVYLIFKEAIHNIVRHSGARRVEVGLGSSKEGFALRVVDDGRGFDPAVRHEGNGLVNMRRRAAAVDGRVQLQSAPGRGTVLTLTVPLEHRRPLSMLRVKRNGVLR
jgi:signal transduction histidine kinase